jgi:PAS domain S-box-containing protein
MSQVEPVEKIHMTPTILVVEDEGIIAESLRRTLISLGYHVLEPVARGDLAVEAAVTSRPDLALVDIKLSGDMDGVQAAERILAQVDIPIVYLTAFSDDAFLKRAQRTDPYGYLVKPVQDKELYATIEMALYKHKLNRQLKESEEKFRQVTESIREVFWLCSKEDGRLVYVSPAYETLFDGKCQQLYDQPEWFLHSVHEEDRERVLRCYSDLIEQNIGFDEEYRVTGPDQSERWVRGRAYPITGADGKIYRFSGTIEDITERKAAEQEKDALIEISQLFIEARSIEHIFGQLPQVLARRFRFPIATIELLDSTTNEIVFVGSTGLPHSDRAVHVPVIRSISEFVLCSGQPLVDSGCGSQLDRSHPVPWTIHAYAFACVPLKIEDVTLGVLTLADPGKRSSLKRLLPTLQIIANHLSQEITRKRAENALKISEANLKEAQAIARLGRWDLDMETNYLAWSELIYELFEVKSSEFEASYEAFLNFIHPDDRALVNDAYTYSVQSRTPYQVSHRLKMADGRIKWVNEIGRTEYDEHGRPIRSFGIVQDVTELKMAEERTRQMREMFTKAFHTSPDSININRMKDGLYVSINEGFTQLTGYTKEDVDQKTSGQINIWANAEDRIRLVRELLKHGEVKNFEARFRLKSGETRYGLMSAKMIEVNGEGCILSITRDITERKLAEEMLRTTGEELRAAYDAIIRGWSKALELREHETAGHSQRVSLFTLALAKKLGIPGEDIIHIQRGALLHDIGKMGIPDNILLKNGKLTDDEWMLMRQHPDYAYQLLSEMPFLSASLDIPYYHHERWDGKGYPVGLRGEAIPLAARIFSVVDVWDALLHDRPYRLAWNERDAVEHLREQSGRQFDPQVVDAFLQLFESGILADAQSVEAYLSANLDAEDEQAALA